MKNLVWAFILAIACLTATFAADPSFTTNQLELVILPGFNHVPQKLTVSSNGAPYVGDLTVSSDSAWVTPSWDAANRQVWMTFTTSNFVASQTATIRIQTPTSTNDAFVHGTVSTLNILKLVDDSSRSRVYGVDSYGLAQGAIVVIDPLTGQLLNSITVGKKPTDLAVSATKDELLVLNSADKNITVIDLASLTIKEVIQLPEYGDWGPDSTSGNLKVGAGDLIYYSDGNWAPILYVYNRATKQNIQKTGLNDVGFGDFALTSDNRTLIAWAQYGWSAGWAGSYIARFSVESNGAVTLRETTDTQYPTSIGRDPLETPVLINNSDTEAFVKQMVVNTGLVKPPVFSFSSPIYAISPGGEIACTSEGVYERSTGNHLLSITGNATAQVVTSDYARLVYFDPAAHQFKFVNLVEAIGAAVLGRQLSPADKSIVVPPAKLIWSPVPGVDSYRVFFGSSRAAVESATTNSPEYLGATSASEILFTPGVTAGSTYYWRVDAVSPRSVVAGTVYQFTVSSISSSVSLITGSTLQGYKNVVASFDVSSATAGAAWIAQGAQPWISFAQESGVTPATIQVIVDASKLNVGITNTSIFVGPDTNSLISIPLRVRVEPVALTMIKSDPTSPLAYAISENAQDQTPHAYLLEIDTANELITRIVDVGSGVTDIAIHNPDGRVYVTNWRIGSLLAVNKSSFKVERTYAFPPFAGVGYGNGDVYRISAGVKGRLVVEPEDQWITISIFDTVKGTNTGAVFTREGGGAVDPTGRYYYHGDDNISNASLHKFDMTGDVFTDNGGAPPAGFTYGNRTVVISEDGARIFWGGSVYHPDMSSEWAIGDIIYSCTPDGRYAFGQDKVYDVALRKVAFGMPVSTPVSTYNSTSKKLIVQNDGRVDFFQFDPASPLPKPTLTASSITATSAVLSWTDESLETGFTLQSRVGAAAEWTDLLSPNQNVNQVSVTLQQQTDYQFRVKANSAGGSSEWSDILQVSTPGLPPTGFVLNAPAVVSPTSVRLSWQDSAYETAYIVQRHGSNDLSWATLSVLPANTTGFVDSVVIAGEQYAYRVTASNSWATVYGEIVATVPFPQPPVAPQISGLSLLSGLGVRISWSANPDATGFDIERTIDGGAWSKIATVDAATTIFDDRQVENQREYTYRISAINSVGRSNPSETASILAQRLGCIIGDDFENGLDAGTWSLVQGGQVIGDTNGLLSGKALWFGAAGSRLATTLPISVQGAATLHFSFRAGNPADGTNLWEPSEFGEGISLEYSTNGTRWLALASYNTLFPSYSNWTTISVPLPFYTWSDTTQIRWRQLRNSGANNDTWALDDVCIEGPLPPPPAAPPFLMATSNSSHSMALLWVAVEGTQEYIVERASAGGGWSPLVSVGGNQTWYTDTACSPSSTYAYRVKARNASGDSAYSTTAFGATISQLIEWQVANFGSASQPITSVGSDGIALVARYAFNLPATGPTPPLDVSNPTSGLPVIEYNDATDCLEVTFVRRKAAFNPGITYDVQFSDDLATWKNGGTQSSVGPVNDTWELAKFTDSAAARPHRFCRIAIGLSP